jgi:hypothetical protein
MTDMALSPQSGTVYEIGYLTTFGNNAQRVYFKVKVRVHMIKGSSQIKPLSFTGLIFRLCSPDFCIPPMKRWLFLTWNFERTFCISTRGSGGGAAWLQTLITTFPNISVFQTLSWFLKRKAFFNPACSSSQGLFRLKKEHDGDSVSILRRV